MNAVEMINDLPKTLINWYDFPGDAKVLFISGGRPECEALFQVFKEKGIEVVKASMDDLQRTGGVFDYIVAAGLLERSENPEELLRCMKRKLKKDGKMLIGTENRLGIRYFCGDKDEFSGHVLDGIDNYIHVSAPRKKVIGGRAYSKAELEKMLRKAGIEKYKFYSVMPELIRPQILVSENYRPNESVDVRIFPQYKSPETIFLEEERLYAALMDNNLFHPMANAFLIECSAAGKLSEFDQITVQGDRGRGDAMATIIKSGEWVAKKALYPEGREKINVLYENTVYLKQNGVPTAEAHLKDDEFVTSYIDGQIATEYFRELLRNNKQSFLDELKAFQQMILSSSEHVPYEEVNWRQFEPWWEKRKKDDPNIDQWQKRAFGTQEEKRNIGIILKRGYIDMVSLNCFYTEKGFVFFDQEFVIENLAANAIFIRTIDFIYRDSPDLEQIYPKDDILEYFKLAEHQNTWRAMGNSFLEKLRNEKVLSEYNRRRRRDGKTILSNRYRMDYSQEEYEKLFTNIFRGIGNKKLYLFGSGEYARQFLKQFGAYYEIAGIVDNNEKKWGGYVDGITVYPPSILEHAEFPFKVFICIKYFESVLLQLQDMGIRNIAVYDPGLDYELPLKMTDHRENRTLPRYAVGYVAGVFDLFHIGHLNLIRRAKEQCEYLIVGVISDEQVIRSKKTRPYIPFEERLEIVQACRYVDEAVEVPADRPDTEDAYYRYHFDVQFSGSDYADNPDWLAKKVFLQKHGADLVFFPYTQTTSSTEIKEQIRGETKR